MGEEKEFSLPYFSNYYDSIFLSNYIITRTIIREFVSVC